MGEDITSIENMNGKNIACAMFFWMGLMGKGGLRQVKKTLHYTDLSVS